VADGSVGRRAVLDEVFHYFPVLFERRRQIAGYLSGGERQMLALGMALSCSGRLLLVDELSLGLAPLVAHQLLGTLVRLRAERGLTILFVEQNAAAALEIADYGYVLERGRIVYEDTAARLLAHADIREFYLGVSQEGRARSYRDVKQYRRKRRWHG
jgi:branched-chain amino acid transport system ATP-binding protein